MIYLDQAATSLQKPPEVCQAMLTACKTCAGYARSGHAPALRAGEVVYQCREAAAQLFSVDNPEQIIFTMNATHALNLAIHGFCTPSTVVAVSSYEHNSVMRPLHALGCPLRILRSKLFDSADFLREAERAIDAGVQIFIINHVSNVFGSIIPLEQLDAMLQAYQIPLILDASQSAGTIPISVHRLRSLRAVCMPGHKGLLGPRALACLFYPIQTTCRVHSYKAVPEVHRPVWNNPHFCLIVWKAARQMFPVLPDFTPVCSFYSNRELTQSIATNGTAFRPVLQRSAPFQIWKYSLPKNPSGKPVCCPFAFPISPLKFWHKRWLIRVFVYAADCTVQRLHIRVHIRRQPERFGSRSALTIHA